MSFKPRKKQAEVLQYRGGTLGISAVPGSGKTHTLSALAADLIERLLKENTGDPTEREVLIVTFSNAAVLNFSSRIAALLAERGMIPGVGYKVCTLHSMALEILRGHTRQLGIDNEFQMLDEAGSDAVLQRAVSLWWEKDNRATFDAIVNPNYPPKAQDDRYRDDWQKDVRMVVRNVISQAKDYHLTPEELRNRLDWLEDPLARTLMAMVSEIYAFYQTQLRNFPAMDFADLMFNAYRLLKADPGYLAHLQQRWPYILEDEAQDSSLIQEEVLRLLTAQSGNWVRVGDPNQAINETFTTANPIYLRNFLKTADRSVEMDESGRSSRSILAAANRLVKWAVNMHPNPDCRDGLAETFARMTARGDAQGNPPDDPARIQWDGTAYSGPKEVDTICRLAVQQVREHPEETTAILTPSNDFGKEFVDYLSQFPVEVVEVLRSTRKTRDAAETIATTLEWLSLPLSKPQYLKLFHLLYGEQQKGEFYLSEEDSQKALEILNGMAHPEDFFYPADPAASEELPWVQEENELLAESLFRFRYFAIRWLEGRFLPVDQLILLIGQDLFENPEDLCTAGQIGGILSQMMRVRPEMSLTDLAKTARDIAANGNLYAGLRGIDSGFDPNDYPGKIIVTTYHKSKGLEWDQVYLTSCNDYDFPGGQENSYAKRRVKPAYMKENLDMQAEILQMLRVLAFPEQGLRYRRGEGSRKAWLDSVKERMRLLYVGITRAKRGLHVSWNSGKFGTTKESELVMTLRKLWQNRNGGPC